MYACDIFFQRFNVAITRAKALLIVIGNPNILQHDDSWREFIKFCNDNGACTGVTFEFSSTIQNVVSGMENLTLNGKRLFVYFSTAYVKTEYSISDGVHDMRAFERINMNTI